MKKSKKLISISIIIMAILIFLYFGKVVTNNQKLDIPNQRDVSYIELYGDVIEIEKYHKVQSSDDISKIYNSLLDSKKSITKESVNDTPHDINSGIRIVLTDKSNNRTTLFIYKSNDSNYYIEKPYEGIYGITVDDYEVFTQYFVGK
ncbi:MAG: DUF5301 domain-containing protein [Peptostreptococcaceae bacterium]